MASFAVAPKCPACGKSVYAAEEAKALDCSWHQQCFCCKACGKSLRGGRYKDHGGEPYCEADHQKLFGPKGIGFGTLADTGIADVAKADESLAEGAPSVSIKDRLKAFEGTSGSTACGTKTGTPSSRFQSYAPKCPACNKSVYAAEEVKGLGQSWHALCFCCKACGKSLRGGNYKDHDGQPYCEADHAKLFGPKGIGFGTTLGDTGVATSPDYPSTAEGYSGGLKDKLAAFEGKPADGEEVQAKSLKRSSIPTFQSYAPKCPACNKSVYAAEEVKGLGQSWHALCFCCKACGKSLRGGNYKDHDGQPYCEADHTKLFGPKGIGFGTTLGDTGVATSPENSAG